jgi:hypothetical protein
MREKIWLAGHELRHKVLYQCSEKYRQALRVIDIQNEKIFWLETQLRKLGEKK